MKKEEMDKILQEEKEFIDKIDEIVKDKLDTFSPIRKEHNIFSYQMLIEDKRLDDILKEYFWEDGKYIRLIIEFSPTYFEPKLRAIWKYNGESILPKGHYVRPDKSRFITITETLRECIKQGTNEPDIKDLEIDIVEGE